MIGWLLAPVLPGAAFVGLYVWAWLTVPRRASTASTAVVPWQPTPAPPPVDLDAEFGRAVREAARVADEMEAAYRP